MAKKNVLVGFDRELLERLDGWAETWTGGNRTAAITQAIELLLQPPLQRAPPPALPRGWQAESSPPPALPPSPEGPGGPVSDLEEPSTNIYESARRGW